MANYCVNQLKLLAVRVSVLTSTGAPVTGSNQAAVSDQPVTLNLSPDIETGQSGTQLNGAGEICGTFKDPDRMLRLNLSMELCKLDNWLYPTLIGGQKFTSGSDFVGAGLPGPETDLDFWVCFEGWTYAWDTSEQLVDATYGASGVYWHWVFPKTRWRPGNTTVGGIIGSNNLPVEGISEGNANLTANGPHNDWPAFVGAQVPSPIALPAFYFLEDSLPTAACNPVSVPTGS